MASNLVTNKLYWLLFYIYLIQHIPIVNCIISLSVGSECVPFDTISSHPDKSNKLHDIGWIKVLSCTEGEGLDYTLYYDSYTTIIELAQNATTLKHRY